MPATATFTNPKTWAFQEGVESSELNIEIRDQINSMGPHLIGRKTSDQNFPNTTLANVTSLVIPVLANTVWRFTMPVIYSAVAAADIKLGWTFPAGGRLTASVVGFDAALNTIYRQWDDTVSPGSTIALGGSITIRMHVVIEGVFITAGTAGDVQLQAAQNTSDATSSVIYTNSTTWAVQLA